MKQLLKRLAILSLCVCMMGGIGISANAASTQLLTSSQIYFDTGHEHTFHYNGNRSRALNQYTSGSPSNGTKVSTWTYDENDPTMQWDKGVLKDETGLIIVVANNPDLAIDFNRLQTNPEVQLYTWINDYYDDVVLDRSIDYNEISYIKLLNRNSYLQITTENTSVYDVNGKVCRWTSTPTYWYHDSHMGY